MTQKDILESVLTEIKHIKTHMPNGELKQMAKDFQNMKEDLSDLKYTLLNPNDGVIVKTNENTAHRRSLQEEEDELRAKLNEIDDIQRWKDSVTKALWIIFGVLATLIIRMLIMHSEQG